MTFSDLSRIYLDVAGVMLIVIDSDQKVSLINKKGCEILGNARNEHRGTDKGASKTFAKR